MEASILWSQESYSEKEEFARSVRISLLGVSPSGLGSFCPKAATLEGDWQEWCQNIFGQTIGPIFRDTYHLATELKLREIADLDVVLGEKLGHISPALIAAAHPFVGGKENMRGHCEWRKYRLKIDSGAAPGHLPVVFALHSVLFRLPLTCALQAYAWLEWKTGLITIGKYSQAGIPEDPPAQFLEVKNQIVRIIHSESTDGSKFGLRVV
jgi:hypothetical protein